MLKTGKLKNSTILFIGILIISFGVCIGLYDYFKERKDKTFSSMNIMLYENEQPENIEDASKIDKYSENFIDDGLRYEISELLSLINQQGKNDFKLTKEESIALAGIMEEFLKINRNLIE